MPRTRAGAARSTGGSRALLPGYRTSREHLLDEIARLELLLREQVRDRRNRPAAATDLLWATGAPMKEIIHDVLTAFSGTYSAVTAAISVASTVKTVSPGLEAKHSPADPF